MTTPDFSLHNHGSLCTLIPLNDNAETWIDDNIGQDVMKWSGGIVIEPRYVDDIIHGIAEDGLMVEAA